MFSIAKVKRPDSTGQMVDFVAQCGDLWAASIDGAKKKTDVFRFVLPRDIQVSPSVIKRQYG
ncbi:MAG: hypothetical protein KAZ17_01640 [Sphingorhabdus sp.]|nr:hypothetical protein [Sphingorhabdus sp.]